MKFKRAACGWRKLWRLKRKSENNQGLGEIDLQCYSGVSKN